MKDNVVWFDFDNSPHVPVLIPIAEELRRRSYSIYLTARDVAQTVDLLKQAKEDFIVIDQAFPKGKLSKLYHTIKRAVKLSNHLRKIKPACALSHSSRSAILGAWFLNVPSIAMYDYEYVDSFFQNYFSTKVLMPEVFDEKSVRRAGIRTSNLELYPGIKEQIYLHNFRSRNGFLNKVGIPSQKVIIVLRPLGSGHYCNGEAKPTMEAILERLSENRNKLFLVALPRDPHEAFELGQQLSTREFSYLIPEQALPGSELVYHADLLITGSGTMAREAAVLGVPAYSIFNGPKGVVDHYLESLERLTFIDSPGDVDRIAITKKQSQGLLNGSGSSVSFICDKIESLIAF